jgi:Pyridoxamine 5'-phosphate oxidase
MGSTHDIIDPEAAAFIRAQRMFFVATAPLAADGHINLSPKGLDSFRIIDDRTVAYLDFVGSGAETIAHVHENGRMTILFCAFEGGPKILRLYGRGGILEPGTPEFDSVRPNFPAGVGARAIVRLAVTRISVSCGFGVPLFEYVGQRTELGEWCERKDPDALREYQRRKNAASIDGLPALRWVATERASH